MPILTEMAAIVMHLGESEMQERKESGAENMRKEGVRGY